MISLSFAIALDLIPRLDLEPLISGTESVGRVCEVETNQTLPENRLHSTGEPAKTCLCESITSGTHSRGKYLLAPNVQSLATSMLARERTPAHWAEWFAIARNGINYLTETNELIFHRRTEVNQRWIVGNQISIVIVILNYILRTRLVKQTFNSNRKISFLSTVEALAVNIPDHVWTHTGIPAHWIEQLVATKNISYFLCNQLFSHFTNSD